MQSGQVMLTNTPSNRVRARRDGHAVGSVRLLLQAEGLIALAGSALAFGALGGSWSVFALLFLLPDLSMLGYALDRRIGAALYNCGHTYLSPALFGALSFVLGYADVYPLALIWTAHIGFDRILGYGLKYPESFGSTHLTTMGH